MRLLKFKGEEHTPKYWSGIVGIPEDVILFRIFRCWSVEDALTIKDVNRRVPDNIRFNGQTHSLDEWGKINNISKSEIIERLIMNCPIDFAIGITHKMYFKKGNRSKKRIYLTCDNLTLPLQEWARILDMSINTIRSRLDRGLSDEEALFLKSDKYAKYDTTCVHKTGHSCISIEFNGEVHTIKEWASIKNISAYTIWNRMNKGLSAEQILASPEVGRPKARIRYGDEIHTLKEWAEITNIPLNTIKKRYYKKWPVEEILGIKNHKKSYSNDSIITFYGESHSLEEWSRIVGIDISEIYSKIDEGYNINKIFSKSGIKRLIKYEGKEYTVSDLSKMLGVSKQNIYYKINAGYTVEEIMGKKRHNSKEK